MIKRTITSTFLIAYFGMSSAVNAIEVTKKAFNFLCKRTVERELTVPKNSELRRFNSNGFKSEVPKAISNSKTEVQYWVSSGSSLSECTQDGSWKQISTLSPGDQQEVIAFGANCTFSAPRNNSYKVKFRYLTSVYEFVSKGNADEEIGDFEFTYFRNTEEVDNNASTTIKEKGPIYLGNLKTDDVCVEITVNAGE
jgi:hypothetical protein